MTAGEFVKLSYGLAVVIMLQTDLLRLPGFLVLDGKAQLQGRVYLVLPLRPPFRWLVASLFPFFPTIFL